MPSRRDFLKTSAYTGAMLMSPIGLMPRGALAAPPFVPPVSPALTKYVDALPIPGSVVPVANVATGFHELSFAMANGSHQFHSALGTAATFGYGGASYLGPTIIARRGQPIKATVTNSLGTHPIQPLATPDPLNVEGVDAQDRTAPRAAVHLHGSYVAADSDGGPMEFFPRHPTNPAFQGTSYTYTWPNDQQAATLWYHDHAFAMTRANVYAGLAAFYLLRDEFDTGAAGNPIGLPAPYGTYEIPLAIQDRSFNADGTLFYAPDPAWIPEFFGDVAVVNGKAWPNLDVEQAVYRFRIINGSQARFYNLSLSSGDPIYQIGTESGLLDAPVALSALLIAPGERADILADFTAAAIGDRIVLRNDAVVPFPHGKRVNRAGGLPLPEIMQFTVSATAGAGAVSTIPTQLRSNAAGTTLPPLLVPLASHTDQVVRQRHLVLFEVMGSEGPIAATINVLAFHESMEGPNAITTGGAGAVQKDTLEQWNIINLTGDTHPMHLHLANFQLLNRQRLNTTRYQMALQALGTRVWSSDMAQAMDLAIPVPDTTANAVLDPAPYVTGPVSHPSGAEAGWKDTIQVPPGEVTRILVPFGARALGAGVAGIPFGQLVTAAATAPYNNTAEFSGSFTGTYAWHCHILDHEENDMMNFYQVT